MIYQTISCCQYLDIVLMSIAILIPVLRSFVETHFLPVKIGPTGSSLFELAPAR